jgi:hypothetical protein
LFPENYLHQRLKTFHSARGVERTRERQWGDEDLYLFDSRWPQIVVSFSPSGVKNAIQGNGLVSHGLLHEAEEHACRAFSIAAG